MEKESTKEESDLKPDQDTFSEVLEEYITVTGKMLKGIQEDPSLLDAINDGWQ